MAKSKAPSEAESGATSAAPPTERSASPVTRRRPRSPPVQTPRIIDVVVRGNRQRSIKEVKLRSRSRTEMKIAKRNTPKKLAEEETCEQMMARLRCQHRMRTVCSRRLAVISKPQSKRVIETWWDKMQILDPQAISRFRDMLDAYEPYSPEQAYDYFVHLKKCKKRENKKRSALVFQCGGGVPTSKAQLSKKERSQRDMLLRLTKGVLKILTPKTRYQTFGKAKILSDMILKDMCRAVNERVPYCCNTSPKALFHREIADKVAVWVQGVVGEASRRMLIMDGDEDEVCSGGPEDNPDLCNCDPTEQAQPTSTAATSFCDCIKPAR